MKGARLNILTAVIGFLLVLSGILKYAGMLKSFEISVGDAYFVIYNSTSFTYILIINLIGGGAMLFHALSTLNLRKETLHASQPDVLDSTSPPPAEPKVMSKFAIITAIISLFVSFLNFIRIMILLSAFKEFNIVFIPLALMILIGYGSFSFIPIWLAAKNFALNNRSGDVLQQRKNAEIRAKLANR